ncbi:hypothetical protein [Sorangium cellulosum]|uniref:Uncharacterized protein n=1 Tax=Sorangium cellulosum TaxID=56 RepID=A0A150QRN0_SORCE|nr:hypothetical protein [Sorangium cellulosum]KYF70643.1 hypothetical protein BE15_46040 [Sorangium cellulosum]
MTDIIAHGEPRDVERLMDRYWFLLRGGAAGGGEDSASAAATQVVRDGEFVVVSVEATALGWPEGTLLFRFRSEAAPCVACVDRAAAIARHRTRGMLTASDVREMLRFAVARCAASGIDVPHAGAPSTRPPGEPVSAEVPASGTRRGTRDAAAGAKRYDAELWLIL